MVRLHAQKNRNPLPWMRTHKFYSLLLLTVLLVAGIFVYEKVALELNKRAFSQARATIDTVYADIVARVGQPDSSKRSNTCSRPSQLFGQGPLFCDVSTSIIYGLSDKGQANVYLVKIQGVIKDQKAFKTIKPLSSEIKASFAVNTTYQTAEDFYKTSGLPCFVSYVFDTPREITLDLLNKELKPLQVDITCTSSARYQYY